MGVILSIDDMEKTVIITEDWGWKNEKDGDVNALHPSMKREWNNKDRGEIKLYNALASFIRSEFPEVKISQKEIELDKKTSHYDYTSIYPGMYLGGGYLGSNGVPYQIGGADNSVSPNIGTGKVMSVLHGTDSSLSINGAIACTKCHIILKQNSGAAIPTKSIVCSNCGEINFI